MSSLALKPSPPNPSALRRLGADALELLSSMRFAVSLLVIICVASVIGTVLVQNQPSSNYLNQFGPFWNRVFDVFSLPHVYNAGWFLLIMAFLVVSTGLCLVRTSPRLLREARSFRESVREDSLRALRHRAEFVSPAAPRDVALAVGRIAARHGFATRLSEQGGGVLLAAKAGTGGRLGYLSAHAAILLICIGGLLDSELLVRAQIWLGGKRPLFENMAIADVPASGRLSPRNPSFRGNALVPEGGATRSAIVTVGDGALVQPLPFSLELKRFIIDYYSTGMPRRYSSEVEVTDLETGQRFATTIQVNSPFSYKGVTVYQSGFDDGGSQVELTGYPLADPDQRFVMDGKVGGTARPVPGAPGAAALGDLTVELTGLRPINVENLSQTGQENLRNVGPSVQYKLRDASGQAREFTTYMQPIDVAGVPAILSGVRGGVDEPFRYLRLPADANGTLEEFMALRALLHDPEARALAARRFAVDNRLASQTAQNSPLSSQLTTQLQTSALRALDTFAQGGLPAVAKFLEGNVPADERQRAADVVIKLLGGAMVELRDIVRERSGLPALPHEGPEAEQAAAWMQMAVTSLSDLFLYPAPVVLGLSNFHQVQASVFQLTRSPGKWVVYTGSLLLILGVFSMFYVRERRLWLWVKPNPDGHGARALLAMATRRRTLDLDRDFARIKTDLAALIWQPSTQHEPAAPKATTTQ